MTEDITSIRQEYTQASLDEFGVDANPFKQFESWFEETLKSKLLEPTAMILSTVASSGAPSQRTVLLKHFDMEGFVFYTNYSSKKANHISKNSQVSLLFPWYGLERQVIISGEAQKISSKESLKYFLSRPRGSQLGAWVSNQSQIISSRKVLELKLAEMKEKFKEGKIPLPDQWGGYKIIPNSFEFWQGRANRLHDRIFYEMVDNSWIIRRLAP